MNTVQRIPNIAALVDPILGAPHAQYDCWELARYLLNAGFDLQLPRDPFKAVEWVAEIWYQDDPRNPLQVSQPWDVWMLAPWGFTDELHMGIVIDQVHFVHTRVKTGVVREPLRRWQSKLFQVARLRQLL